MFAKQPTEMTLKCINAFQNDIPSCPGCICQLQLLTWAMRWAHATAADQTLAENTSSFNLILSPFRRIIDGYLHCMISIELLLRTYNPLKFKQTFS